MLLERNGKLTMWKSKSSRLPYSLVESFASTVYDECEIKVVCQVIRFVSFFNSHLGWIYLIEIIQKLFVIENNQIIYYL